MGWLEEAVALPVAFAQVREDPLLDREAIEALGRPARVIMVASGGCTAAFLASTGKVASLTLVDPNPAQLEQAKLKLHLLATETPLHRQRLMGHGPGGEPGPDYRGRYEALFAQLHLQLASGSMSFAKLAEADDISLQAALCLPGRELRRVLKRGIAHVFALETLVTLFGENATRNARQPFAAHFLERTLFALRMFSLATNPWLAQFLLGRFTRLARYPWLDAPTPAVMPAVNTVPRPMAEALQEADPGSADFVHLSNILDWLSQDEARETLRLAARALAPGGVVVVRQLNSTLDVPSLGEEIAWDDAWGRRLLARDRSFFYRAIHIGRSARANPAGAGG